MSPAPLAHAPLELEPRELKRRLDAGEALRLIDVREPFEHQQAHLDGAQLIPMRTVPSHLDALRAETAPIVVLCHHGMRSMQVVRWLRQEGVAACSSLAGGIDRWSREIDGAVPRYY